MHSLSFRIAAVFLVVVIAAVGLVAVLANQATETEFHRYVRGAGSMRTQRLQAALIDYYRIRGSWEGVQSVLERGVAPGRGQGLGPGAGFTERATLVDTRGVIVADSIGKGLGEKAPDWNRPTGIPLEWNGETIGVLLLDASARGPGLLENQFIASVNRSLLWAALLASALALALGFYLSRRLLLPLRLLTQAAGKVSQGNFTGRVSYSSSDEVGQLARAFNLMLEDLARIDELKKNLVADVAHELRTPLTVLQGSLEALQDGVIELTPSTLKSLHEETVRLTRLVHDLQELSLAEAGQLSLNLRPIAPEVTLGQTVETLRGAAASKGIELTLKTEPDLPRIKADDDRFAQILFNLISNAVRYTPPGGSVRVRAKRSGSQLEVAIGDDGPGIAPTDLPHVFDRFYRADKSRARSSGGAGLGLAIARQLVRAQGGEIWVESQPGRGTTFFFTLPLV
ncbi:MAG: ATP-binding protein [Firmicutes bacterium]|nr:ATP-binding protein [Bacillota bacterium]MCL5039916.1 ATP-binding protein [Bacillota bacterium]